MLLSGPFLRAGLHLRPDNRQYYHRITKNDLTKFYRICYIVPVVFCKLPCRISDAGKRGETELDQTTVPENAAHLRSWIEKIDEQYRNGDAKSASFDISKVFEGILYSLTAIAGIQENGEENFQEYAVNALHSEKWITDRERGKLHELRRVRNAFEHQIKTDMSSDTKRKAVLQHYRDIFPEIIKWCRDDVDWYVIRAEQMAEGNHVENSWQQDGGQQVSDEDGQADTQFSPAAYSERARENFSDSSLSDRMVCAFRELSVPVLLSSALAVLFGLLSNTPFVTNLAEKIGLDLSRYNLSHSMFVIFLLLLVLYILFFHLTAQVICGAAVFALTKAATGSTVCAVLAAFLMVLIVTRFTERLKMILSWAFYGFWLLIFMCSMPSTLRERLGADVPLDAYTLFVHVILPMLLYLAVFALTPFILKSFHLKRPFGERLSDKALHGNTVTLSLLLIAALTAVIAFAERETWTKSLILHTRDFYASPSAFWAVHAVMIALVLYFFSIMKRFRTLH